MMGRQAPQNAASPPEPAAVAGRSPHLDASLDRAHKFAVGQRHPGVSSEHLLFALTEDPDAFGVLGASTISIERLRADISSHLTQLPNDTPAGKQVLPTADLLKVLKLAAMAAQQSSRRQIDGAIVLAAMIGDASTPSAGLLRAHGLTFAEVIRVLQRGAPAATANPAASQEPATTALPAPTMPIAPPSTGATGSATAAASPPPRRDDASTDEILASVRARLQDVAPPAVGRRTEPEKVPPVSPLATAEATVTAPTLAAPVAPAKVTKSEPTAAPLPAPPDRAEVFSPIPPLPAAMSKPPALQAGPRTPADLTPAARAMPLPPPMPVAGQVAGPVAGSTLLAALAPVKSQQMPPSMPPSMPPPMPPPLTANASARATAAPAQTGAPREAPRAAPPPPIPPVTVDMRALANAMPKYMRNGQTDVIEISVPRRALEIPLVPGHRWPPLRVSTLRLKAVDDRAFVELGSPETLWIGPPRAHQGADDAIWRWRVSPRYNGRLRLTLSGATRIVGSEGISAEIPFGEETLEIEVARRRSRRGLVGMLLFGNLMAVGILAMIMSGRAAEIVRSAWAGIASLWGG